MLKDALRGTRDDLVRQVLLIGFDVADLAGLAADGRRDEWGAGIALCDTAYQVAGKANLVALIGSCAAYIGLAVTLDVDMGVDVDVDADVDADVAPHCCCLATSDREDVVVYASDPISFHGIRIDSPKHLHTRYNLHGSSNMSKSTKPSAPAESTTPLSNTRNIQENGRHRLVNEQMADDIWKLLLVFRLINAFCVRTFFQPDEYFQSLEPAWRMVFGPDSGAWLTWEWRYQLRSSLHPVLFAAFYIIVDKPMELLGFFPQFRAEVLAVLPNVVQSIFAAICDYYTWSLAEKLYGIGSRTAWFTVYCLSLV
ncbi:glycosylphosphatidylinositol anchor biosynthesis [Clarireedia jacksonii]